jgi:hypothetical protein
MYLLAHAFLSSTDEGLTIVPALSKAIPEMARGALAS